MNIFVYGSLKKGYWNHSYLEKNNAKFLGNSILFGHSLYHVNYFPGMVESTNPFEIVHGETYEINEMTLDVIDALEQESILYKRKPVIVLTDFIPTKAYTYLYLETIDNSMKKVKNNNWHL